MAKRRMTAVTSGTPYQFEFRGLRAADKAYRHSPWSNRRKLQPALLFHRTLRLNFDRIRRTSRVGGSQIP